jgi:hypothetical protein
VYRLFYDSCVTYTWMSQFLCTECRNSVRQEKLQSVLVTGYIFSFLLAWGQSFSYKTMEYVYYSSSLSNGNIFNILKFLFHLKCSNESFANMYCQCNSILPINTAHKRKTWIYLMFLWIHFVWNSRDKETALIILKEELHFKNVWHFALIKFFFWCCLSNVGS